MIAVRSGQATAVTSTNGSASRDRALVGAARDGRGRGEQADAAVARRRHRLHGSGLDDAEHVDAERRLHQAARSTGSAAAVAELQATTSSLVRRAISSSATSSANASSSAGVRSP